MFESKKQKETKNLLNFYKQKQNFSTCSVLDYSSDDMEGLLSLCRVRS